MVIMVLRVNSFNGSEVRSTTDVLILSWVPILLNVSMESICTMYFLNVVVDLVFHQLVKTL